jgi:hypothetical protein
MLDDRVEVERAVRAAPRFIRDAIRTGDDAAARILAGRAVLSIALANMHGRAFWNASIWKLIEEKMWMEIAVRPSSDF